MSWGTWLTGTGTNDLKSSLSFPRSSVCASPVSLTTRVVYHPLWVPVWGPAGTRHRREGSGGHGAWHLVKGITVELEVCYRRERRAAGEDLALVFTLRREDVCAQVAPVVLGREKGGKWGQTSFIQ